MADRSFSVPMPTGYGELMIFVEITPAAWLPKPQTPTHNIDVSRVEWVQRHLGEIIARETLFEAKGWHRPHDTPRAYHVMAARWAGNEGRSVILDILDNDPEFEIQRIEKTKQPQRSQPVTVLSDWRDEHLDARQLGLGRWNR